MVFSFPINDQIFVAFWKFILKKINELPELGYFLIYHFYQNKKYDFWVYIQNFSYIFRRRNIKLRNIKIKKQIFRKFEY